jgi:hypothetical protein
LYKEKSGSPESEHLYLFYSNVVANGLYSLFWVNCLNEEKSGNPMPVFNKIVCHPGVKFASRSELGPQG